MSITDVQRAFVRGMDGKGSCKAATIDLEEGGRRQRLGFHVIGPTGSAYLSESIPSDMCPMQHARHMAQEFLEGRIAGNSRFETQPTTQIQTPTTNATAPNATPILQADPQAAHVPKVATPNAETVAPVLTAIESKSATVATSEDLDRAIAAGDREAVCDLVCGWIDADAGAIRKVWANDNPGLALEYEQVRREINDLAYQLVEPSPETCPCLWASVGVDVAKTGNDAADIRSAAALINECVNATNEFLARVRAVRLAGKAAVRAASSIEAIMAAYDAIQWPAS